MRFALPLTLLLALPAQAETFRWASQTDPQSMDPHAVSSTPVLGFLNNVYEGLVRRGQDMAIEPSLATSWEPLPDGAGWRFALREGVTFQGGQTFDADDVVFSYERASSPESDVASWFAPVSDVVKVDPYIVDVLTSSPQPIFPDSIANWMMMDAGWAAENDTTRPAKDAENYATLNANGTGPYTLTTREPGLRTVLTANEGWWSDERGNVTEGVFTPIDNPATAVAALLSGDVDMVNPVPIQDVARLDAQDDVQVIQGVETRVILLGMSQGADALTGGDQGDNPFRDVRVRQAVAHAINVDAITTTIFRGAAEPATQLVDPASRGYSQGIGRIAYDPDMARELLAEAGYPDGFAFAFKCTNDRYLNDEATCQAITGMLAQVGLIADLDAMPVRTYWDGLRAGDFDIYLLGWSPGTFDAEHPIRFLAHTSDGDLGTWNFGGFTNARIDGLLQPIQSELDDTARQAMLDEVAQIVADEQAYIPLYIQPLLWGARSNVDLVQRPDDFFILRWVDVG